MNSSDGILEDKYSLQTNVNSYLDEHIFEDKFQNIDGEEMKIHFSNLHISVIMWSTFISETRWSRTSSIVGITSN